MQNDIKSMSFIEVRNGDSKEFISSLLTELSLTVEYSHPFSTPQWLEHWYEACSIKPSLALYYRNNTVTGACLIGSRHHTKYGISFKTALLNQSGKMSDDQAWIEYNDLLCPNEHKAEFYSLLIEFLKNEGFDLFHLSMSHQDTAPQYLQSLSLNNYSLAKGYKTTLLNYEEPFSLAKLSKNTRSQVRRSNKKLDQQFGKIKVVQPINEKGELEFFNELSKLHIQQWGESPEGSGFNNESFVKHQQTLLKETELAQIIGVYAGDVPLGFCLNYLHNNNVYFYCSGVNHSLATSHIKPGYSMHVALMEYYAEKGFKTYDFLGGESRYKASLSDEEYNFVSVTVPLNTFKGKLYSLYLRLFRKHSQLGD